MSELPQHSPEHFKIAFAERFTAVLNKQGLSQTDLAKMMGLSRATVSRWMTDYPTMSSKKLAELSSLMNVSLNWLLLGLHSPEKPVLFELNCHERQILLILSDLEPELREHFMHITREIDSKRQGTIQRNRLKADAIVRDQRLPIVIIDHDGYIIYANEHYDDYFGAAMKEGGMVSRSIYHVIPGFMHGAVKLDIQKTLFRGYTRNFKCCGKRLDNAADLSFNVYARAIETAEFPAIMAIIFPDT